MSAEIFEKVNQIKSQIEEASPSTKEEIEQFRIRFVGSKNVLKPLFGEIRHVENDRKKEYGQLVNAVKSAAEQKFQTLKSAAESAAEDTVGQDIDLTAPAEPLTLGAHHPISITMNRIVDIFSRIGFTVAEDREIEDDIIQREICRILFICKIVQRCCCGRILHQFSLE